MSSVSKMPYPAHALGHGNPSPIAARCGLGPSQHGSATSGPVEVELGDDPRALARTAGCPVSPPAVGIGGVPRISHFHGITIAMHWDESQHSRPHFHAYYGEHEASLDLAGEIIVGTLPRRILRLVQAWAELHADELNANWELAVNKKPVKPIAPLR